MLNIKILQKKKEKKENFKVEIIPKMMIFRENLSINIILIYFF